MIRWIDFEFDHWYGPIQKLPNWELTDGNHQDDDREGIPKNQEINREWRPARMAGVQTFDLDSPDGKDAIPSHIPHQKHWEIPGER